MSISREEPLGSLCEYPSRYGRFRKTYSDFSIRTTRWSFDGIFSTFVTLYRAGVGGILNSVLPLFLGITFRL